MAFHLFDQTDDVAPALTVEEAQKKRLKIPLACDEAMVKANEGKDDALKRLRWCSEVGDLTVPPKATHFTLRAVLDAPEPPKVMPVARDAYNRISAGEDISAAHERALRQYRKAELEHYKAWVRRGVIAISEAPQFDVDGNALLSDEAVEAIADNGKMLMELAHHIRNLSEISELGKPL
jgi:hypothetical protein